VRFKNFINFMNIFGNLVPKESLPFAVPQRGRVIMPMDLYKGFVAVGAFLSLIPMVDDGPNQASRWGILDLLHAFLTARLLFGPTRACTQPELFVSEDCFVRRLSCVNAYGGVTMGLRTGDNPFPAELQISSQSPMERHHYKNSGEDSQNNKDEFHLPSFSVAVREAPG
jgi:hypothetical protein